MKAMLAFIVLVFAAGSAFAADSTKKPPTPAQQAQQERMKACNAEAKAKALKGAEHKTFMSGCLKAEKK
jgi:hypothetical protein